MIVYNENLLVRIAQADAYCCATEYINLPHDQGTQDQALEFQKYISHPTHGIKPGYYSDDTQMSIAIAEVLLAGNYFNRHAYVEKFFECFKRDHRKGYSKNFYKLLCEVNSGKELLEKINSNSDKNGAAMRSVPLGVLPTQNDVLKAAEIQASITHNTEEGILSSQAVALLSHFALYRNYNFKQLCSIVFNALPQFKSHYDKYVPERLAYPNIGIKTACMVFWLLQNKNSLINILKDIIEFGGDTDTVAAITVGIASSRYDNFPKFFDLELERNEYGYHFLKVLGKNLINKFGTNKNN